MALKLLKTLAFYFVLKTLLFLIILKSNFTVWIIEKYFSSFLFLQSNFFKQVQMFIISLLDKVYYVIKIFCFYNFYNKRTHENSLVQTCKSSGFEIKIQTDLWHIQKIKCRR